MYQRIGFLYKDYIYKKITVVFDDTFYLKLAVEQAILGVKNKQGGPFGAVIIKNDKIIAQSNNMVLADKDPTAHAEIVAIRAACKVLGHYQLTDCIIYASCEPCPMCMGALYWARPAILVYACTRLEASAAGFDDSFIYDEIALKPEYRALISDHLKIEGANSPFEYWAKWGDKNLY